MLGGLCPELAARGLRVTLVAVLVPGAVHPRFLARLAHQGIDVEVLHVAPRAYRAERERVLAVLKEREVDLVHTHGYRTDVVIGTAARRAGYPVISTLHGFTRQGVRGRAYEWVQLRMLRRFEAVVAVSEVLATELAARGIPPDRIRVIRNGVTDSGASLLPREEARRRLGLPADVPVVGWVGRLSEEKEPELAIRGFAEARHHTAWLCVVGDGPLLDRARATAVRLGVDARVRFAGAVTDASDYFRAFDLLMLSSRTEGTPMAILEAGVAGVPVVATAVGGIPALLGERSRGLVPPHDSAALGGATARILCDVALAHQLAAELRGGVLGPEAGRWVDQYANLYRELASHRVTADRAKLVIQ